MIETTTKPAMLAHGAGLAVFAALKMLSTAVPQVVVSCFATPAAWLTSLFLGSTLETTHDGGLFFFYRNLEVAVTNACSGFGFFSLSCALLTGFAVARFSNRQWRTDFLFGLLTVFCLTILTNAFRMVCAVQIRLISSRWVPESYDTAIHMAVGMVVFIPVLLLSWNLLHKLYEPK